MILKIGRIIFWLILSYSFNVYAKSNTANLDVSATVVNTCSAYGSSVNFGEYSENELAATISIFVTCTSGTKFTIGLGTDFTDPYSSEGFRMKNGKQSLMYKLYSTENRTKILDESNLINGVSDGTEQEILIYAYMQKGQIAANGLYSDLAHIVFSTINSFGLANPEYQVSIQVPVFVKKVK